MARTKEMDKLETRIQTFQPNFTIYAYTPGRTKLYKAEMADGNYRHIKSLTVYLPYAQIIQWLDGYSAGLEANQRLTSALEVMIDQACETYPHFESARGQRNLANARLAVQEFYRGREKI